MKLADLNIRAFSLYTLLNASTLSFKAIFRISTNPLDSTLLIQSS